ncbi:hypothetical protein GUITHDRAFT_139877 [Guillardia theta CCMP2712]|uniref:Haem-binding uptake Tiki superfamily ChaN domain-containing protein n=1 Tax=Guillardia theta (strain CCMP2712) TaxID=905079 RepID=L1J8A7_GUITC|nr:hypothetical protein GUITHDRAFT_139877 [Guillardia theta CCMP2712]EKX44334.1 hypothetical protein GUITHDRAFT_139877 [Guillardia theta CCMP2712]|eukprot:XP_005831314.1 hypothetical protein GUITHDRAFT_139877 [Guillardia theta CCMP2712]
MQPGGSRGGQDIASLAGGYDVVEHALGTLLVLIGEVHDDPTAHELELGILQECFQRMRASRSLHLSLEMFETDVQRVIDEYTRGIISERDMMVDGRAWMNYPSDYRKMVEFAKEHGIPVIAANAPRRFYEQSDFLSSLILAFRYISVVGNRGMSSLDQLSSSSRSFLPPLPVPPASGPYQLKFTQQMQLMQQEVAAEGKRNSEGKSSSTSSLSRQDKGAQGQAAGEEGAACPYIGWSAERSRFMLEAQNLWDATMAHSIAQILNGGGDLSGGGGGGGGGGEKLTRGGVKDGKAPLVIHVTGKFHCEERLGIPEHLHRYAPHAKVMVVGET